MRLPNTIALSVAALVLGPAAACLGPDAPWERGASAVEIPEGISPELVAEARARVALVAREVDKTHVTNHGLPGDPSDDATLGSQFVDAAIIEYRDHPDLLRRRLETLASMVLFSAPEVTTKAAVGRLTPFHGMNDADFEALMDNEDFVFNDHMRVNGGSPQGVRPFSVCETKYLIGISTGALADAPFASNRRVQQFDAYAQAYLAYTQGTDAQGEPNCTAEDLADWYNFRGLGHLRPTWLESNISDRFLGRMVGDCDRTGNTSGECARWQESRLGYRDAKNTELTLREVFYDPNPETRVGGGESLESTLANPGQQGVLTEDRNGDGIGEWIAPGPGRLASGARLRLGRTSPLSLPADQTVTLAVNGKLMVGSALQDLPAGTTLTVKAGSSAAPTTTVSTRLGTGEPVRFGAGTIVELGEHANVVLVDGTLARTPSTWEAGGNSEEPYRVQVRLGAEASWPVDASGTPYVTINKVSAGPLAANSFAFELRVTVPTPGGDTLTGTIAAKDVEAYTEADPRWDPAFLDRPDLGLMEVFSDGSGCQDSHPSPETCPLMRRFYTMIDRHESFYQTYSSVRPYGANVSQQPSPLVACSITLRASHSWDSAGIPAGGRAGFIYLMRIPFAQILAGDIRSIDTLSRATGEPGPQVLTVQELYQHGASLDMSRVWLDIATLSNNLYSSEHEISKFGSVPAEQIEGILVVRRPAGMPDGTP